MLVLLALLAGAAFMMLPLLDSFVELHLAPGLGVKDAAVVAFFVTVVLLVILAFAAGDGLLGELQYMIGAFVALFLMLWLAIAWIF